MRTFVRALILCLVAVTAATHAVFAAAHQHEEFDDCEANFIAFLGADAYQFSPSHEGELGGVRLFTILSFQHAAALEDWGRAFWRLTIRRADSGQMVWRARGSAELADDRGTALVEHVWRGRDLRGKPVASGKYRYTFESRFVPHRLAGGVHARRYEDLADATFATEALASTDELIVRDDLPPAEAKSLRALAAAATTCQLQLHAPIEGGFGYNFYYGSTHAHSNFSDGGQPTTACTSGSAYGSGSFTPTDVFTYARDQAGMDFWVVNEHNHLINDSVTTNNAPLTEAKVLQRYQDGRAAAAAATVNDQFVGLYGMEWGVSTNTDQGHVTLLETPVLFGWETCTTCNGPNPECTVGSNCYFDVFTPKRFGYLTMYQRSVENPSPAGALGIFAHPGTGNFDNFAFNANADNAMQGIAVRSGLAFSTGEDCLDSSVGATDYSPRWREALNLGFHLGPVADHDSHCNNFGKGVPTRTVYLLPNGTAPVLTKPALLAAHRARHFFATEDPNVQLVFATSDGHIMGDIFAAGASIGLHIGLSDPNGDPVQALELWRGQIGGGALSAPYLSWSGQSSVDLTEAPGTGTWYYFVHAVQADGHDVWSAPLWITFGGGGCGDTTAPVAAITAPVGGATVSCLDTLVQVSASDAAGIASVSARVDGGVWNAAAWNATSGRWEWSWPSGGATSGAHTLEARATDASCGANIGLSAPVAITIDNIACGGSGTPIAVGGWTLTQANAAGTYTIPAGTTIPANGYLIVGRNATQSAFQSFWGVTLGSNVAYLNSGDTLPVINGSETFSLAQGVVVEDGPTIAMATAALQSVRRNDPCQNAGLAASWTVGATTTGTPGTGAGAGCGTGVVINEFADASGTGNFIYEFLELHYDAAAASDTQPPSTAITAPAAGSSVAGTVSVTASATDNVGVTAVEFLLDAVVQATDTTPPYAWNWNTATASNGSHSLTSRAADAAGNTATSAAVLVTANNDTQPPTTAITAPTAGSSVAGTVSVTASATDNVGVTSVTFLLDGVAQATDTASPYSWSWNTTTATNGAHTLTSRAQDGAGNIGTSAAVAVTVSNGTNIANWRLVQANAALTYVLPAGTVVPNHGYLIIARNATKAAFETFWGVTLASNVVYLTAGDSFPQINGSENYTLFNAAGTRIDGATIAMAAAGSQSVRRNDPCLAANQAASWTVATTGANPGSGAGAGCAKGMVINEFTDAAGTGNFVYEFVELHNDR
jgi:Bacterial Ig domain